MFPELPLSYSFQSLVAQLDFRQARAYPPLDLRLPSLGLTLSINFYPRCLRYPFLSTGLLSPSPLLAHVGDGFRRPVSACAFLSLLVDLSIV